MDLQNLKKFIELIATETDNEARVEYFSNQHVSGFRLSQYNEESESWEDDEFHIGYEGKTLYDCAFDIVSYLNEANLISDYQKVIDFVFVLFS